MNDSSPASSTTNDPPRVFQPRSPGVELCVLRAEPDGSSTFLIRMQKGARAERHGHPGGEETFVLSGHICVDRRLGAAGEPEPDAPLGRGDYLFAPPGETHEVAAHEESTLLVIAPGGIVRSPREAKLGASAGPGLTSGAVSQEPRASEPTHESSLKLEPSWKARLGEHFQRPEMQELSRFLRAEKQSGKEIYPRGSEIFAAFDHTPFDAVRVVILGQDPYHGPGQAHGLCFSVRPGVPVPPSLDNVFQEIERDLGIPRPNHGCLLPWAQRGVLLLNAVLTVERGRAASHQNRGWEGLTDAAIAALNREREGVVFLLWGSHAQRKGQLVDARRHLVLRSSHPSPYSANMGFLGCGHFSAANRYLEERGLAPIDWSLPPGPPRASG